MSNVRRIKKRNFTATDNQLVRDNRLSWKARGIFNYLWSQSEEWNFYVEEVAKHSKDGIKSLKSGLSELEKHGYLKRTMLHDENGFFKEMSWELSDTGDLTVSTKNGRTDNTVNAKNGRTDNGTLRKNNIQVITIIILLLQAIPIALLNYIKFMLVCYQENKRQYLLTMFRNLVMK